MFRKLVRSRLAAIVIAAVAIAILSVPALAHESREVGDANFVVGFLNEPAFEGQINAASIRITTTDARREPVAGQEESLQVEIRHLATGESMTTDLEERFNDPGHYVTNFIPTAPGTYEFRVFGTIDFGSINEQEIYETFTGGPTMFSDVVPAADVQFPVQLASAREVEGAARGAQDLAEQAVEDADSAGSTATLGLIFGIMGTGVGVTGVGLGLWGLQAARKRV